jgi:hypothetical protein
VQIVAGLRGICSGPENFVLVVLQHLYPALDVCGLVLRVVGDAQFGGKKQARQIRAYFFLGVFRTAERLAVRQPVEPVLRAGPMRQLMKAVL